VPVLPTLTNDAIAAYLTNGYWADTGGIRHSFPVSPGGTLTIDMSTVATAGRFLAVKALDAWTMISGINFSVTNIVGADIVFTDNIEYFNGLETNPYGGSAWYIPSGEAVDGFVNISTNWLLDYGTTLGDYSFSTYMHEIGHALGLGHAGNYDGTGLYATDGTGANTYLNDSWQATLMSYFSPFENTSIAANWDYFGAGATPLMTPMVADILAIWDLYGTPTTLRTGDTTYGVGSNAGGYYDTYLQPDTAFTIVDNGGIDKINFSNVIADQRVTLTPESISDVGGRVGNMIIMRGTIIEKFISGAGNDDITGNTADNTLWGGGGNDVIRGGFGLDIIRGGTGNDTLNGNRKHDLLIGEAGNDILRGGGGRDKLDGGAGDDRLEGGIGRDKLFGGTGADTFVFKAGWAVDRVSDFEDNIDTIELNSALWLGTYGVLTVSQVIATFGTSNVANNGNAGTHVELDFGAGDVLKIHGISNANLLLDDITII